MWSFLKPMCSPKAPATARRSQTMPKKARLHLEALEDRRLMSTVDVVGGELQITTGNLSDTVTLDRTFPATSSAAEYVVRIREGSGPIIETRKLVERAKGFAPGRQRGRVMRARNQTGHKR